MITGRGAADLSCDRVRVPAVVLPLHATPDDQPPPFTAARLLTEWSSDWRVAVGIAVPGVLYVAGLVALRRRGDRWPVGRSVAFLGGGLGSAALATPTALGAYDTVPQRARGAAHDPDDGDLAAPGSGRSGHPRPANAAPRPRRLLLGLLHTRLAKVLTFPPLALALFVVTPFVLYYSSLYELTLRSAFWHGLLHLHFVTVGALLMWPLVGLDPVPGRIGYPFRLLVMFLMLPFHAILGISIMGAERLIAEDWYLAFEGLAAEPAGRPVPGRRDHVGQRDVTAVLMLGALFVQWFRHSQREARREDRRLDLADRRNLVRSGPHQPHAGELIR